jgi:hypothetical protein
MILAYWLQSTSYVLRPGRPVTLMMLLSARYDRF